MQNCHDICKSVSMTVGYGTFWNPPSQYVGSRITTRLANKTKGGCCYSRTTKIPIAPDSVHGFQQLYFLYFQNIFFSNILFDHLYKHINVPENRTLFTFLYQSQAGPYIWKFVYLLVYVCIEATHAYSLKRKTERTQH